MDHRPHPPEHGHPALAVGPFGPWVAVDPGPGGGAELGFGSSPDGWRDNDDGPSDTGTALDEFLGIYWLLGHATKHRPAYRMGEVDLLDIAAVASLLGVSAQAPDDPFGTLTGDFAADSARLIQQRIAAARAKAEVGSALD